jgi:DNA-binding response OmpR family regulator
MLVVDDDVTVAGMFQRYFLTAGCDVDIASSATEAQRLAGEQVYAVALLDLRLTPGSGPADGLALLKRLRTAYPALVIVILTAFADAKSTDNALALGADRVLQKPQPLRDLVAILAQALERRMGRAAAPAAAAHLRLIFAKLGTLSPSIQSYYVPSYARRARIATLFSSRGANRGQGWTNGRSRLSRTSRTLRVSVSGVSGFWMNAAPWRSTPRFATASPV